MPSELPRNRRVYRNRRGEMAEGLQRTFPSPTTRVSAVNVDALCTASLPQARLFAAYRHGAERVSKAVY